MDILFNASAGSSLGVEVELQLVDQGSRELRSGASEILRRLEKEQGEPHPKAKNELIESNIELITGVCSTVAEARADLEATLAEVVPVAEDLGLALLCAGTHPFSDWAAQDITPNERYHRLVDEVQWPARRMAIFGIHTHVGVRSAEKAIAIANALTGLHPAFPGAVGVEPLVRRVATPGWRRRRTKVFEGLPTAGLPQRCSTGGTQFQELMTTLISAKAISSIREIWWDIRPHPNFGTVELRICDGLPTMTRDRHRGGPGPVPGGVDGLAHRPGLHAALPQAVDRGAEQVAGRPPRPRRRDDRRRAGEAVARCGTTIADLVEELTPVARRLGCESRARRCPAGSSSTARATSASAAGSRQARTLPDVVDGLIEELRSDQPG